MFYNTYEDWLVHYRPILGGDGEDDDSDTSTADVTDNETETDTSSDDTETNDSTDTDDNADNEDNSSSDADLDELERIKAERDQARQEVAKAQAAARKAKDEARKTREDAAKKHGNWEQVAKERQTEIEDLSERLQSAETDKVSAQDELDRFRREVRITRLATKLAFRDSQDAIQALKERPEDTNDDKSCERALRKLAENKPYLVDQKRARGRAMNGNSIPGGLTHEQLKNMSPEEINANWEQVSGSLARGGSG